MARRLALAPLVLALCAMVACGGQTKATTTASGPVTLRLGYFPNLTHAPAILGIADSTFARALGTNVKLETKTFNAGPAAVEALFANAIDASYVGPNPAIN